MTLTLTDQEVAVLKLIDSCEAIAGSGLLGEKSEQYLRERIVATCNAFGFPTIAERVPSRPPRKSEQVLA